MFKFSLIIFFFVVFPKAAQACHGPESEAAQESDATVLFEGHPVGYEFTQGIIQQPGAVDPGKPVPLARVSFKLSKVIKGAKRERWDAIMRGSNLPKSLAEFTQKFGPNLRVGLRDFGDKIDHKVLPKNLAHLFFVVDAACAMNGEDWLLRPIPKP